MDGWARTIIAHARVHSQLSRSNMRERSRNSNQHTKNKEYSRCVVLHLYNDRFQWGGWLFYIKIGEMKEDTSTFHTLSLKGSRRPHHWSGLQGGRKKDIGRVAYSVLYKIQYHAVELKKKLNKKKRAHLGGSNIKKIVLKIVKILQNSCFQSNDLKLAFLMHILYNFSPLCWAAWWKSPALLIEPWYFGSFFLSNFLLFYLLSYSFTCFYCIYLRSISIFRLSFSFLQYLYFLALYFRLFFIYFQSFFFSFSCSHLWICWQVVIYNLLFKLFQ